MEGVVSTTSDMLSGIDGADFSAAPDTGDIGNLEASADTSTGTEEVPAEAAAEAEPVAEEPAAEPEPEPAPEPEPPAEAAADLPEGVREITDRKGNKGMFVPPERWSEMAATIQTNQKIAEQIGEALTEDAVVLRHRALLANEQLQNDLMSGDPASQANVLKFFQDTFAQARKDGFIGHDPMVPFAEAVYSTLRDSNPDAYAALRFKAANDLVQELYDAASTAKDRNLWLSAGHTAKALGMKYRPDAEMEKAFSQPQDPTAGLRAENEQLRQQSAARAQQEQEAQFNYFQSETGKNVRSAISEGAILPAIPAAVADAWKSFPAQYQEKVMGPLQTQVNEIIKKDAGFNRSIGLLSNRAKMAATAQARESISQQIVDAYKVRARLAADAVKGPILREAAEQLKTTNQQQHQRQQAAAQQRGPKGPQNPVQRSLIAANIGADSNGYATHDSMMRDLARTFSQ